jgi:oxygen-independent coproporphyrinogen-3 oxidase
MEVFMSNSIGLYIHIPFCKSKCPYCDFYSSRGNENEYDNYTNLLIEKIKLWSTKTQKSISTVYFGGGTPSVLGADRLCKILNAVKECFSIVNDAEITVEINPDTGKTIDFGLLKSAGFNRLSVGMQSAVAEELRALGRIHSAKDAETTIKRAKEAQFENISLDLMLGIPHQTISSLEKSIEFCNSCGVTHISSYILKIEENTHFYKIQDKLILPDEDYQAEIYLKSVEMLDRLGYKQYEISNFAKQGYESKHNTNYWKCREYLGIGPSAHSFLDEKRFYYSRNMNDFVNDVTVFDCNGGDEEEFVMLALRLKSGLNFAEYQERYGHPISSHIINKAKMYEKLGYMNIDESSISLTTKGFLVSNAIISELI